MPQDSLQTTAWNICVEERAYYIVGACMAKQIDEKLGRKALVGTIAEGPIYFIDLYNSLVGNDEKVFTFRNIPSHNWLGDLKNAALHNDLSDFAVQAELIKAQSDSITAGVESQLLKLGYGMLYLNNTEMAINVFTLNTDLFPGSANTWDCLAEAYLKSGNKEKAIFYYQKALTVDPEFTNAKKMLSEITG